MKTEGGQVKVCLLVVGISSAGREGKKTEMGRDIPKSDSRKEMAISMVTCPKWLFFTAVSMLVICEVYHPVPPASPPII